MTDFGLHSATIVRDMAIYHLSAQRNMKTPAAPTVLGVIGPNYVTIKINPNALTAPEILLGLVIIMHLVLTVLL